MPDFKYHIDAELPSELVEAFNDFMIKEAHKCEQIVAKDLAEFLKPLPETYKRRFWASVSWSSNR